MKKPSLYPCSKGCWVCADPVTVTHHIYPGNGRRSVSDREGCTIQLCNRHHNMSNEGVHFNKKFDAFLRADCQRRWEQREGIDDPEHTEFRHLFGVSYL